jgi:glucose dehydrogenase
MCKESRSLRKYSVAVAAGAALLFAANQPPKPPYSGWSAYGGSADSMQYSALKEVNKSNVKQLELAWFYPAPGPSGRFAFSPMIIDGIAYLAAKKSIVAVDATTGKQIWSHPTEGQPTNRGLSYWQSKDGADRRLIFAANSYLQEINLRTGVTIPSFGNDGRVDLRAGLGRDPKTITSIQSNTPGRVFENLIIMGSAPGEGFGSAPGDIRAYDLLTGKLVWTFHTIPHPGEFGYDTWPPDAWKYVGGANSWGELSLDEKRGIAYFALGAPTYDFYGADRIGANLFGDCVLALNARTGKRLWHQQLVHHDLWDYDPTTAPKLMSVRHNGKMVDIVAQPTKFGFLYVFNRVTGEPLWPIEERPVPQSHAPGEQSWPTQPFPTKPPPFARQKFTVDDINSYVDPAERERLTNILTSARNEGIFTPPGLENSIEIPGELGGSNWGGSAADPETGMLYVRGIDLPAIHILHEASGRELNPPPPAGQKRYMGQYATFLYTNDGQPAISPPWTQLTAYDLNEGTIKWQIPVGTVSALAEKGIRNTGSYRSSKNGPVVTAGGLIFMATEADRTLHAYDKDTGALLWERQVDANPVGIPSVYEAGGRQFVAFATLAEQRPGPDAASWNPGKPEGQGYYVLALPKNGR